MKYGLWCIDAKCWMMETKTDVAVWESVKEADKWRRNHTVHPDYYQVKLFEGDME